MKSHADALVELAKDSIPLRKQLEVAIWNFANACVHNAEFLATGKPSSAQIKAIRESEDTLIDKALAIHDAQRKQLESRVEKLEGARNLLSILVLELTARKFRAPSVRSDPYSAELRHALNLARQWLDADDALAKEQPNAGLAKPEQR